MDISISNVYNINANENHLIHLVDGSIFYSVKERHKQKT